MIRRMRFILVRRQNGSLLRFMAATTITTNDTTIIMHRISHKTNLHTIIAAPSTITITIDIIIHVAKARSKHKMSGFIGEVGVVTYLHIAVAVAVASCRAIREVRPFPVSIEARNSPHSVVQTRLRPYLQAVYKLIEARTLGILSGEKIWFSPAVTPCSALSLLKPILTATSLSITSAMAPLVGRLNASSCLLPQMHLQTNCSYRTRPPTLKKSQPML